DAVHVSLDQAWHDCLAVSIDHPRPITDQLLHFGIRTHSHKAALADSGSFDNRGLRINRHDFAIQHDEIGRWLSSWHDLADQESTQGQNTRLWASHRLAENTESLELCQQVYRAGRTGTIETSARSPAGASWNHHQKRAETERSCVRSTIRALRLPRLHVHQDENDPSSCELPVGKNRSGETGAISFLFQGSFTRFEEATPPPDSDPRPSSAPRLPRPAES